MLSPHQPCQPQWPACTRNKSQCWIFEVLTILSQWTSDPLSSKKALADILDSFCAQHSNSLQETNIAIDLQPELVEISTSHTSTCPFVDFSTDYFETIRSWLSTWLPWNTNSVCIIVLQITNFLTILTLVKCRVLWQNPPCFWTAWKRSLRNFTPKGFTYSPGERPTTNGRTMLLRKFMGLTASFLMMSLESLRYCTTLYNISISLSITWNHTLATVVIFWDSLLKLVLGLEAGTT